MPLAMLLTDLGAVDARRWPGLVEGLRREGAARLVAARFTGGAIALGRYQRGPAVLSPEGLSKPSVRRATGGRAIVLGEGALGLALVLPHRSALAGDDPEALPASRFVNRAVRGVLSGLARLGVGATYFGRDFLTLDGGQGAFVSFEVGADGHALLEVVVAAEAHWALPRAFSALPEAAPQRGVPGPALVAKLTNRTSAELLAAVAEGYVERFGVVTNPAVSSPIAPATVPGLPDLPLASPFVEVPVGFVQTRARLEGGRLAQASFEGDFLADSAGIEALQAAVIGCAPALDALAPVMNAVYARQRHTILGLPDLAVFADGLVRAAGGA
jgi:hypothetical protein